jgi:hypothetical protein
MRRALFRSMRSIMTVPRQQNSCLKMRGKVKCKSNSYGDDHDNDKE